MKRYWPKGKAGKIAVVFLYAIIYFSVFFYLENRTMESYHIIECGIDRWIPFCSIFILPYLMWFPYQIILWIYFLTGGLDDKEYYRFIAYVCSGMSLFLIISWLYPTAVNLRPQYLAADGIFERMVLGLYCVDTPTNVLPSIHVYNSIAFHVVFCRSFERGRGQWWKMGSFVMSQLIILSTVLIRQHSVIDLIMGFLMAVMGYLLIYGKELGQVMIAKLEKLTS
ncbi:MAG: phosphatase PAP2 family protein [Lachnospiraceae bacterium]|nr:phosphatase PAP2 family protein [Lachnospiraceae bacterium]